MAGTSLRHRFLHPSGRAQHVVVALVAASSVVFTFLIGLASAVATGSRQPSWLPVGEGVLWVATGVTAVIWICLTVTQVVLTTRTDGREPTAARTAGSQDAGPERSASRFHARATGLSSIEHDDSVKAATGHPLVSDVVLEARWGSRIRSSHHVERP
jgi:hypothetical protein